MREQTPKDRETEQTTDTEALAMLRNAVALWLLCCVYHSLVFFLRSRSPPCVSVCLYRFLNGVSYVLHIAFETWHMALRFASHLLTKHHTNVIKSVPKRITQAH